MIDRLRRLLARIGPAQPVQPPVLPVLHTPLAVVGDLHGRLDLLERLLPQLDARAQEQDAGDSLRVVFVGDMIDRGPDSAGVLTRLHELSKDAPRTYICLMGNHERMMLDFLEDPERHGPRWLASGGTETVASFGLSPWGRTPLPELAAQLRRTLPPGLETWLQALPLSWRDGQIAVTHAGADPAVDLGAQSADRMLWGARGRAEGLRKDGLCVVQGHVVVDRAGQQDDRVMVDTGAWSTDKLSVAWVDPAGLAILEA